MAEYIVKLLVRPGRPITLVFFDPLRRYPILRGTHQRGLKIQADGKNGRFLTEIAVFISVTMRDRPMVTVER